MKKENIVTLKIKRNSFPRPTVTVNVMVIRLFAKRVFGFEKPDPNKFFKSPDLDEVQVAVQLAKLEADMNWIKRMLWVMVVGGGAGFYFG